MKKASEKKLSRLLTLRQRLLKHDQHFLDQGFKSLAGVDEAGRGPLAGPVVAAAVIVRDFSFSCPVDDSKKMTAADRDEAFAQIVRHCVVGVGIMDHRTIDEINIYEATMGAMQQAIEKLEEAPDCVLVDGPRAPFMPYRRIPIVDGDAKSFSIACASIVAKVTRDRMMEEYDKEFPGYGFAKHKGYGTKEHMTALTEKGPCTIHRRSFEPVRESRTWSV